jgi:hypothetical protein
MGKNFAKKSKFKDGNVLYFNNFIYFSCNYKWELEFITVYVTPLKEVKMIKIGILKEHITMFS